jgi:hypothetical protein
MAPPVTVKVELYYSAAWQDITSYVYMRDPISITRGEPDEANTVDPSQCTLTINNRTGRFSNRNPSSPLYGLIGRNTQLRVTANSSVRFVGEVSAWPQTWDMSGSDIYFQLTASGILRRLGQGQGAAEDGVGVYLAEFTDSALTFAGLSRYDTTNTTYLVPYLCSGNVHYGTADMGQGQAAGITVDTTNTVLDSNGFLDDSGGYLYGLTGFFGDTGGFGFNFRSDNLGIFLFELGGNGDYPIARTFRVYIQADGTDNAVHVKFRKIDYSVPSTTVTAIGTSTGQSAFTDGNIHNMIFTWAISGGTDTAWNVYLDGVSIVSGTVSSEVFNGTQQFQFGYQPTASNSALGLAYITTWNNAYGSVPSVATLSLAALGYDTETAADRISRLCTENGITYTLVGTAADTIAMGAQPSSGLVATLQEAATTDGGVLYEPRSSLGLAYRTRTDQYDQSTALTVDYSLNRLGDVPQVVDDDQGIHNDVTVSNADGSSARATLTTGTLSTQAPPNGINTYPGSVSVNVDNTGLLDDLASWQLHLGTVDEARWPTLTMNMNNPHCSGITTNIAAVDVSSKVVVTNLPAWLPPDDVTLFVLGYSETIDQYTWTLIYNCKSGTPFEVAKYGTSTSSGTDRFDAENSTLSSSATTTATSLSVASAANTTLWTTDSSGMPFDVMIAGERITVTAISGASSPQTFTVTRSVNGVVKAHSSGEAVHLFRLARFGL